MYTEEKQSNTCDQCNQSFKHASILLRHRKSGQCLNQQDASTDINERICVLHMGNMYDEILKVHPFTEETLKRCHTKKEIRDANIKKSKYRAIILPSAVDEKIGYHTQCYKNFCSV